jgi:hypothetical protein
MMWSSHGAGVLDWFLSCLMIVGFTMLLGLSVYLTMSLLHVERPEPPDEVSDRWPFGLRPDQRIAS